MDTAKKDLAERLKSANNILVTVSRNPSVDQLSACLGLALLLNKQGKHTAAVFSGQVPSTIEFLKPEDTLEQNTDSLRDFIIALDKSKADKLRYKVEDNVVRIFITPYKTSISDADLEFSQGDFNVDVVVALGVSRQEDLDEAITSHGRILHDATVASVNTTGDGGLGSINWHDPKASSLSELVTELAQAVGPNMLDGQIATALLTGIVSETDRFSNDKTTSVTMNASAALMAAGANQQLVASKLEEAEQPFSPRQDSIQASSSSDNNQTPDGTIEIDHSNNESSRTNVPESPKHEEIPTFELPSPDASGMPSSYQPPAVPAEYTPPVAPLETPVENNYASQASFSGSHLSPGPKYMDGPPSLDGKLTANSEEDEEMSPAIDPFSPPNSENPQLLDKTDDVSSSGFTPPPPSWAAPVEPQSQPQAQLSDIVQPAVQAPAQPLDDSLEDQPQAINTNNQTPSLAELEAAVKKSEAEAAGGLDTARDEVSRALTSSDATSQASPEPILALGAQPLGSSLHPAESLVTEPSVGPALASPQGPSLEERATDITNVPQPQVIDSNSPPPVPPPIPFQFGNPTKQ